ncbi:type II toxin-antitoxin system RelE/ParE family toxin [Robiginitalea marina]|uniref:type II toxin-antitoxin system RelE/ParE family toxin n=1 Tax=Robiginitalea marina TaxID=2954105 RepID=UPI0035158C6E
MVRISWLDSARQDLREIFEYISPDSARYAKFQIERIFSRTQILKKQPSLGKVVEEIGDPNIRELVEGNYRIIYRIVNQHHIHILMVHHASRDLGRRI